MAAPFPSTVAYYALGLVLACRNDRQQQKGFMLAAGVNRVGSGVVVGMVVHVGSAADAIARMDIEPDAIAALKHHGGRPDFDVNLHDLARFQIKPLRVLVIWAV